MKKKQLYSYGPLSKNDTNIIKGVGMLMIMFHNFLHLIRKGTGENEFSFSADNFKRFIHFTIGNPFDFFRFASSYFGHYGVQLFIFISSYGLYLGKANENISWINFMKKRIKKLYAALALGIVLYVLIYIFHLQSLPGIWILKRILLKLTLLFGFIPNEALSVSGPWWFFSMIIQLYALFPLLLWLLRRMGPNALIVVMFLFIGITMVLDLYVNIPGMSVYFTFIGQMPVFALGLYFAAQLRIKISKKILLLSIIIFALGNVNRYVWYFSFVAITLLMLVAILLAIPYIRKSAYLSSFLEFTGSLSLFLFIVNGLLRNPFIVIAEKYQNPFITFAVSFVFIALVYITALIIRLVQQQILEFIDSGFKINPFLQKIK